MTGDKRTLYWRGEPANYIPWWFRLLDWVDRRTPRWLSRLWEFIAHDWRRTS